MHPRLLMNPLMSGIGAARRSLASDAGVVVGVMVFQNLLRIGSSMILTRLLNVEAFAVAGIVTSVMVTFALISDVGIIAFMVRHERSHEREFRDQVWTLRLIRGIVLSILIAVLASTVADYMQKPYLQWAIAAAGLFSIIDGLGSMAPFTALRNRKVRLLSAIDVMSQLLGAAITIALALVFHSYWAIIFSSLLGQLMGVFFSYKLYPDSGQRFNFSRERAAELWQFSRFITGSTMLTLVISQGDKLVLSRAFPLSIMGLYVMAAGLAATPVSLVGSYAGRVLYPQYAEIFRTDPGALKEKFYSVRMRLSLLYAFAVGGFIGCAPLVVNILYDPRYTDAGHYLQILLISTFFAAGTSVANDIMITIGKTSYTFAANIVRIIYLGVGAWLGWRYFGPIGIIWVVGTVELAGQIYAWTRLARLGFFRPSRELLIIAAGLAGLAIGYGVDVLGHSVFHIR